MKELYIELAVAPLNNTLSYLSYDLNWKEECKLMNIELSRSRPIDVFL
jgi:hypothetical protein